MNRRQPKLWPGVTGLLKAPSESRAMPWYGAHRGANPPGQNEFKFFSFHIFLPLLNYGASNAAVLP